MRWRVDGARILVLASLAGTVRANEPARFRWSWVRLDGAESCPSAEAVASGVRERLGRDPFSDRAERDLEGTVARSGDQWLARLSVLSADGSVLGSREIESSGADCSTLAEAVTLAVALTIDPQAALGPPPSPAPAAAHEAPAPEPEPEPPPSAPMPVAAAVVPAPSEGAPEDTHTVLARLGGLFLLGVLPQPAFGVESSGELGLSSWLRLSGGVGFVPATSTNDEGYAFGLSAAALGLCLVTAETTQLVVEVCGEGQLGAMHAAVYAVEAIPPSEHFWAALRLGPHLGVRVGGPVRLDLGALGVVPLLRHRFALRGVSEPVFQSSAVGFAATLGLGASIP